MKKIISSALSLILTFSTIFVHNSQAIVLSNNISLADTINSSIGKITDYFLPNGDIPQIIFIQDLHSSSSVQKNISEIINTIYKNYDVNKILIEGGKNEKLDTEILDIVSQYNITDELLQDGILSGSEYYYMKYNNKADIWGLENFELYLDNINRAKKIFLQKEDNDRLYIKLLNQISKNIPNYKKLIEFVNFDIDDELLYLKMAQPILKYESLYKYWLLLQNRNKINLIKVKKQQEMLLKELKQKLSYSEYFNFVNLMNKKEKKDFYSALLLYINKDENTKKQYENLYLYLNCKLESDSINVLTLFEQKNNYVIDFNNSTKLDEKIKTDLFIIKMTNLLKSFLDLSITEKDYQYFVSNYNKYLKLISNYLGNEGIYDYEDILINIQNIFVYHNANIQRNQIFVNNIIDTLKNQKNKKCTNVVVAGGFHTSILNYLKNNNISYLLVTPNIVDDIDNRFYNTSISSFDISEYKNQALQKVLLMVNPSKLYFEQMLFILNRKYKCNNNVFQLIEELDKRNLNKAYSKIKYTYNEGSGKFEIDFKKSNMKVIFTVNNDNKIIFKTYENKNKVTIEKKVTPEDKKFIKLRNAKNSYVISILNKFNNKLIKNVKKSSFTINEQTTTTTINYEIDDKFFELGIFESMNLVSEYLETVYRTSQEFLEAMDNSGKYSMKAPIQIIVVDSSQYLFRYNQKQNIIEINEKLLNQYKNATTEKKEKIKVFIDLAIFNGVTYAMRNTTISDKEYKLKEKIKVFIGLAISNGFRYAIRNTTISDKEYKFFVEKLSHSFLLREFDYILDKWPTQGDRSIVKKEIEEFIKESELFDDIFTKKFNNYQIDIDGMIEIIKRKNFSADVAGQEELKYFFYKLGKDKDEQNVFKKIISKDRIRTSAVQINKVQEEKLDAIQKTYKNLCGKILNNNTPSNFPQYIEDIVNDNLKYIKTLLPNWLFNEYMKNDIYGFSHSLDVLLYTFKIIENGVEIDKFKNMDVKSYIVAVLLHDICCFLTRDNHEENSANLISALYGQQEDYNSEKIREICLGQKDIIDEKTIHVSYEAKLLHDAEALCSDTKSGLDRVLFIWKSYHGKKLYKHISFTERIDMIKSGLIRERDGGDCFNDLIRHYLKSQNPETYITDGAKEFISKEYGKNDFERYIYKKIGKNRFRDIVAEVEKKVQKQKPLSINFSDIHGQYTKILELLYRSLFNDFNDSMLLNKKEMENNIIIRLKEIDRPVVVLGDILDRGPEVYETFCFINRLSKELNKGQFKYIMGNHDLYCFSNLLGMHLPFYDGYEGIKQGYKDFNGKDINKLLQQMLNDTTNSQFSNMQYWEQKLSEYMKYADEQQKQITKNIESALRDSFNKTFGHKLGPDDKDDVLSNPKGSIFEQDAELLEFMKKIYGRNISGKAYIGLKGAYKMSIKWWIDRQKELENLRTKYSAYEQYWDELKQNIDNIVKEQKEKYEEQTKNNPAWAVIDAIMYGNYETAEWNALDWVYHSGWGDSKKGLIYQVNKNKIMIPEIKKILDNKKTSEIQIKIIKQKYEIQDKDIEKISKLIDSYENDSKADKNTILDKICDLCKPKNTEKYTTTSNYLQNDFFMNLRDFYKENFYIYHKMEGTLYMHCVFPFDNNMDVIWPRLDANGMYGEYGSGISFEGKEYKGEKVFDVIGNISGQIRGFKSFDKEILHGLKLLIAPYPDNLTRIKPENLRVLTEDGTNNLYNYLSKIGVFGKIVIGHNPMEKLVKYNVIEDLENANDNNFICTDNNLASKGNGIIVKLYSDRSDNVFVTDNFYGAKTNKFKTSLNGQTSETTKQQDTKLTLRIVENDEDLSEVEEMIQNGETIICIKMVADNTLQDKQFKIEIVSKTLPVGTINIVEISSNNLDENILKDPEIIKELTQILIKKGYDKTQINNILGNIISEQYIDEQYNIYILDLLSAS